MNETLLIDNCGHAKLVLNETAGGATRFSGVYQRANEVNKNKRMYSYEILNSNVEKLAETIKERGLLGECDHPSDSIVHLANASHLITKLWWEGNELHGESEILNTPMGKVLRSLIESGTRVGISSRGVGNGQVDGEGTLIIKENFKLITFDCVADPSTFAAFQQKITGKKESFEPTTSEKPYKPKLNHRAFVSYFGAFLDSKINDIKNKN